MIPFLDVRGINRRHSADFHKLLDEILEAGWFILGDQVAHFESEFAKYCGTKHCVGVGNGLDALRLVLQAWGIGSGDEVIVPSNTYIATWLAVSQVGATPIPVEPDLYTYNINPDAIESAITSKTKAIIPVHLYGQAADVEQIMSVAEHHGIKVLEDASQAHGATQLARKTGSLGHAAAFSLYPGKNLGALGDAGCITTDDQKLADALAVLRNYGSRTKYFNEAQGCNSRLDEIHGAFLRHKLRSLDEDNAVRARVAGRYLDALKAAPHISLPKVSSGMRSVWHLFVIRCSLRAELQEQLNIRGIETMIHYPLPPHLQQAYANLNYPVGSFPISEKIHKEVLSLPMGPTMTDDDADTVISAVHDAISNIF
jgi:dTDP-4-amino-4,6-dideoxygalactose transaminase